MKTRWLIVAACIAASGCTVASQPEETTATQAAPPTGDDSNLANVTSDANDAPDRCATGEWRYIDGAWINVPIACNDEPMIDTGDPPPFVEAAPSYEAPRESAEESADASSAK